MKVIDKALATLREKELYDLSRELISLSNRLLKSSIDDLGDVYGQLEAAKQVIDIALQRVSQIQQNTASVTAEMILLAEETDDIYSLLKQYPPEKVQEAFEKWKQQLPLDTTET